MDHSIVKIKKSHRTAIRWFAISGWVLTGILQIMTEDKLMKFLILSFIGVPLVFLYGYFQNWAISFYKGEIIRNRWGRLRRYTWNDIQEVTSFRSKTEGEYVRIQFRDGKAFQFRKEDENAQDAVKLILKHRSIRSI